MLGHYNPYLVVLSVLVAWAGSYTALSLAERVFKTAGRARQIWLAAGAVALGLGIWSMHFIGMLALSLPIPMTYHWLMTAASEVPAIGAAAIMLNLVARQDFTIARAIQAAATLAAGVCVMHYSGMAGMAITPAIHYNPWLVAASVGVAVAAASAAIVIIYAMRRGRISPRPMVRVVIAGAMGLAIAGMHYTGMAAADFDANSICTTENSVSIAWLAASVAVLTLILMGIGIVSAIVDSHMASQIQRFNQSLTESNGSLKRANDELARLASHDALTGLPNRVLIHHRLDAMIAGAEADETTLAVMFIDLDRFKVINDSLGHHIGDLFLSAVSERLTSIMRPRDVLGRLGGDEFVVLCRSHRGVKSVMRQAKRILTAVSQSFQIDAQELQVSASIGISLYPHDGKTGNALMINADAAMYHAKQTGRNNIQFYAPVMGTFAQERLELEGGLRKALLNREFTLHYQPKVDVQSGAAHSYEALVRWNHPTRGTIAPATFITIAEETGLICALGEWVLNEACRQTRRWQLDGVPVSRMAVNVSGRQFQQDDFVAIVERALAQSGLEARCLELELTESTVMSQPERAVGMLEALSALGIHISIDDFGTGYSSLAYLRRLPLNKLKIDRAFVQGLTENAEDASIVAAIISMAHSLRLEVIAEGVETQAQLEVLRSLGCDQFQGFLFSPPVEPGRVARQVADARLAERPRHQNVQAPVAVRSNEARADSDPGLAQV